MAKATMYQRIQELAAKNGGRTTGHGEVDPVTGLPKEARSKQGPTALGGYMRNELGKAEGWASDLGFQNGQGVYETSPKVNGQYAPTPEQMAQQTILQETQNAEKRRKRGRASTMLTGSEGLLTPNISRRSLMGF